MTKSNRSCWLKAAQLGFVGLAVSFSISLSAFAQFVPAPPSQAAINMEHELAAANAILTCVKGKMMWPISRVKDSHDRAFLWDDLLPLYVQRFYTPLSLGDFRTPHFHDDATPTEVMQGGVPADEAAHDAAIFNQMARIANHASQTCFSEILGTASER